MASRRGKRERESPRRALVECILTLVRQEALCLLDNAPRQGSGRHLDATPSEGERGLEEEGKEKGARNDEREVWQAMIPLSLRLFFFFFFRCERERVFFFFLLQRLLLFGPQELISDLHA